MTAWVPHSISVTSRTFAERPDTAGIAGMDERCGVGDAVRHLHGGAVPGHQPQPAKERPGSTRQGLRTS